MSESPGRAEAGADLDLSFVVETINLRGPGEFDCLEAALAALERQTLDRSRYEILVVVDPDHQPALRGWLEASAPGVRVVEAPGTHYYAQKNLGARLARGRIVGFVDADCDPVPTWAESVLEAFGRGDPALGAVQGSYDTPSSKTSTLAQVFLLSIFGHQAARSEQRIPSLAASNCALRRDDLVAEPFEESPFFHGPDVRMVSAMRTQGRYVLLVPGAANTHDHEPGLRAMLGRGQYWGYCFLQLRRDGAAWVRHARLFRRLGPLAPLVLGPAKAFIDLRQLARRRRELGLGPIATAKCAALLVVSSASAGVGGARYMLGMDAPEPPQVTTYGGHDGPVSAAAAVRRADRP